MFILIYTKKVACLVASILAWFELSEPSHSATTTNQQPSISVQMEMMRKWLFQPRTGYLVALQFAFHLASHVFFFNFLHFFIHFSFISLSLSFSLSLFFYSSLIRRLQKEEHNFSLKKGFIYHPKSLVI